MKNFYFLILFLLLPSVVMSAPICGVTYGEVNRYSVVNDHIDTIYGLKRITYKSTPKSTCGTPNSNPLYVSSSDVRFYYYDDGGSCPFNRYYIFNMTSPSACVSSCSDGVLNQDEVAVDCGGVCSPCEPSECHDQLFNGDEEGYDCGGSCDAPCVLICPDGLEPLTGVGEVWEGNCYGGIFAVNALGDCPPDTVPGTGEGTTGCVGIEQPILVSDSFSPSDVTSMGIPPIDYSFQGDSYEYSQDATFTTEDNGDGTSTETTVTTSTSGEGTDASSETTTRIDVVDNTTSSIITSSITTVVNESANENLETYGFENGLPDIVYDYDITDDIPDLLEIDAENGFFENFINDSSFFSVLTTAEITTSGATCSVSIGEVYGTDLDFDLCPWQSHLQTFGVLLLMVCQFYALLIIYRGWKS